MDWNFDQSRDVAALPTRQVITDKLPILIVTHYEEDCSWAFTCGTTNRSEDAMLVSMGKIVDRDPSLRDIADLPPGWSAYRDSADAQWIKRKDEEGLC